MTISEIYCRKYRKTWPRVSGSDYGWCKSKSKWWSFWNFCDKCTKSKWYSCYGNDGIITNGSWWVDGGRV